MKKSIFVWVVVASELVSLLPGLPWQLPGQSARGQLNPEEPLGQPGKKLGGDRRDNRIRKQPSGSTRFCDTKTDN